MKSQQAECPRTEQLSALIDGELPVRPREEIESHAAVCPLCGPMLRDLTELHLALRPLSETLPGIDLAPLVERHLAPLGRPQQVKPDKPWWHAWPLLPSGLAAAGVLSAGVYLGALLAGGAAVSASRMTTMAIFDPVPPGGICVGFQSCYSRGK